MSDFSLNDWVRQEAKRRGLSLWTLGEARDQLPPGSDQTFTAGVRSMLHWCRVNEGIALERYGSDARVYAGFERLSRLRPVLPRYRALGERVQRLVLFGQDDYVPPICATTVDVADGPMAREWFLLVSAPNYKALLVARDRHGFGPNGPLKNRRFEGITTHDEPLINAAAEQLERLCQARAHTPPPRGPVAS